MSGPRFFQTGMGQKFYEVTVPRIATALERIATALEEANARNAPPAPDPNEGKIKCDDCGAFVRGPRLLSDAGIKLWHPDALKEHEDDCKWMLQVKRGGPR